MKRKLIILAISLTAGTVLFFCWALWAASNQILFPSWRGIEKNWCVCHAEGAARWGDDCGNLRVTKAFQYQEVEIPSANGYALPGWLIAVQDNGMGTARGVIMLIHGGGG
jgi:uncharacterized protein